MKPFHAATPAFVDSFLRSCYDSDIPWTIAAEMLEKAGTYPNWHLSLLGEFHEKTGAVDYRSNPVYQAEARRQAEIQQNRANIELTNQNRLAEASRRDSIRLGLGPKPTPDELLRLGMHKEYAQAKREAENRALVEFYNGPDPGAGKSYSSMAEGTADVRRDRDAAIAKAMAGFGTRGGTAITPPAAPLKPPATEGMVQGPGETMRSYLNRMRAAQGLGPMPESSQVPPMITSNPAAKTTATPFGAASSVPGPTATPTAAAPAATPAPPAAAPAATPSSFVGAPALQLPPPTAATPPALQLPPPPTAATPPVAPAAPPVIARPPAMSAAKPAWNPSVTPKMRALTMPNIGYTPPKKGPAKQPQPVVTAMGNQAGSSSAPAPGSAPPTLKLSMPGAPGSRGSTD